MLRKKTKPIKFYTSETCGCFIKSHYQDYFSSTLTKQQMDRIGSIQSHGLSLNHFPDKGFIKEIKQCFINCPPIIKDIVAWRAGKMKFSDRPYLSASLLKEEAQDYISKGNKLHKIIIKKGAKIIPLFSLGEDYRQTEIIIETARLKNCIFYYLYK